MHFYLFSLMRMATGFNASLEAWQLLHAIGDLRVKPPVVELEKNPSRRESTKATGHIWR